MTPAILPSTEEIPRTAAATRPPKRRKRPRNHCAGVTPKDHVPDGPRRRRGNPTRRYTAGSFRSFLERFHGLPKLVIPQRAFMRETYHTVLQILSDRLYPTHLSETLPRLPFDRQPGHERMGRWWREFRGWLKKLNHEQRAALEQQTVLWRAAYWECAPVK